MFHSDLRQEIAYQQARLGYKREKVTQGLRMKVPFSEMEKLYSEIREIEQNLRLCFEESAAQQADN